MKKGISHQLGVAALITATALSGINAPLIHYSLQHMPTYLFAFLRVFISLLIIGPLALYARSKKSPKKRAIKRRDLFTIIIASLLLFCGSNMLFYLGIQHTSTINASIISLLGPILLFIMSVEVYKEKFEKKVFAGIGLSFVGASLVILGPMIGQATAQNTSITGNLLIVCSVVIDVISILMLKQTLKRVTALDVLAIGLVVSAAVYFFLALPHFSAVSLLAQPSLLLSVLYGGIMVGCIGYGLNYYGLAKTKGSDVSITSYVGPVVAMITAVVFFNEQFTPSLLLGAGIVFTGLYLVEARSLVKQAVHHGAHR